MAKTSAKQAKSTVTRATTKKTAQSAAAPAETGLFGLPLKAWVASAKSARASEVRGSGNTHIFVFGSRDIKMFRAQLKSALLPWQLEAAAKSDSDVIAYAGKTGHVLALRPPAAQETVNSHHGRLVKSDFARVRDQVGGVLAQVLATKAQKLVLNFVGTTLEQETAALVGLELASYSYAENRGNLKKPRKKLPPIALVGAQLEPRDIRAAADLALATNVARHLINLPGGTLNPTSYAQAVEDLFTDLDTVQAQVWRGADLERENCGLIRAVGQGADEPPCLVHIRYRPKATSAKPIALVGKGITFDSGGLDIKPSSAMRLMKKDMGGSAAVVGALVWAARAELPQPIDAYLAIAENAVSGNAFRPGDIITSRAGITVEIDNTDAEGRLVLADALDVAVKQTGIDAPLAVLNLATLTGAIKVALGADISGLFCNHDELSKRLEDAGWSSGELTWRMPLYPSYMSHLKSTVADCANSGPGGFAGAISAALFLQQFVGKVPWAHLDIYSWKDSAQGAWAEGGGSGQGVQMLAQFLSQWASEGIAL